MKAWALDTVERAGFTFVESFIGLLIVDATNVMSLSLDVVEHAAVSALIAALAVVKAAIATRREGMSPASMIMEK